MEEEMKTADHGSNTEYFEAGPKGLKPGIAIRNLKKVSASLLSLHWTIAKNGLPK